MKLTEEQKEMFEEISNALYGAQEDLDRISEKHIKLMESFFGDEPEEEKESDVIINPRWQVGERILEVEELELAPQEVTDENETYLACVFIADEIQRGEYRLDIKMVNGSLEAWVLRDKESYALVRVRLNQNSPFTRWELVDTDKGLRVSNYHVEIIGKIVGEERA